MKGILGFTGDILKITLISLVIILPIRFYVAQPFFVRGASMEQSFHDGDYLIVDQISYRLGDPNRGDVIVFKAPTGGTQFLIKRIIGLPGETIAIREGVVRINGQKLAEKYLNEPTPGDINNVLGEEEFFVLGDNRDASFDSRQWGVLPKDNIVGRAWIRAWPVTQFNFIDIPQYGI